MSDTPSPDPIALELMLLREQNLAQQQAMVFLAGQMLESKALTEALIQVLPELLDQGLSGDQATVRIHDILEPRRAAANEAFQFLLRILNEGGKIPPQN